MSAQYAIIYVRRFFPLLHHEVYDWFAVSQIQSVRLFPTRYRHFLHLLTEFDARRAVNLDQLVHATQRRLPQARHEVRPDAESRDRVTVLIQRVQHLLVNVVARRDAGSSIFSQHVHSRRFVFKRLNLVRNTCIFIIFISVGRLPGQS